ncbi:MAG TPA: hypothetical protein VEL50_00585 [Gemmatimonadales bacterium]|nr:hypothetical protein [Gemmatimonadales bacterium]
MRELRFKASARVDGDEWTHEGEKISSPENLAAVKTILDENGLVLLEHKFLRGGRGPDNVVFDDYDEFVAYLTEHARAGDKISVWNLGPFMRDTPVLARGKCPDQDGTVPNKGPY